MKKAGLVLTTIRDPLCLEGYYENFKKYGHLEQVEVIVVADLKTPKATFDRCMDLHKRGLDIRHVGTEDKTGFLKLLGLPDEMFPFNSDNRRNIGYLIALAQGVDFVISIDDDNFCEPDEDYFANHELVCYAGSERLSDTSGWLNACDWLDTQEISVFQRGFPYSVRRNVGSLRTEKGNFEVHANQGLWLGEPDLDALAWVVSPCSALAHSKSLVVGYDTWAPINSQNTAVRAEAMPAYYFIPMGASILGMNIDHDGDIFQGYFLQKCMKHLGGHLRIGTPIVKHVRNPHNYFDDVEKEWMCIRLLEEMLPWLTDECQLTGSNYCEAYESLAANLEGWAMRRVQSKVVAASRDYLVRVARNMWRWSTACRTIGVGKGVGQSA